MKTAREFSILTMTIILTASAWTAGAQVLTIARKIKSMHTKTAEVSTVTLEAAPFKVYRAVTDTVNALQTLKLIDRNDRERQIVFMTGTCTVKMEVDSLGVNLTRITVYATDPEQPSDKTSERSIHAIMAVCKKLGITCSVEM